MTMAEMIKFQRESHDLSMAALGRKLDPPVNASAINKWEHGRVTNIKRSYIEQMARLFQISSVELMCMDDDKPETVPNDFQQMYLLLNDDGRSELKRYMKYLISQDNFVKKESSARKAV